jgi:hypothetical protein
VESDGLGARSRHGAVVVPGSSNPDPVYFGMIELDDDYEMVYVHMVKQGGKWKVCYQTTGPSGFG